MESPYLAIQEEIQSWGFWRVYCQMTIQEWSKYLRNLIVPNVIFSIALESMGTAKLQLIMERHCRLKHTVIQSLMFSMFL